MNPSEKKGIFMCHSSVDKEFVRKLADDLRAYGIRVWLDEAEMRIGESLIGKIGEAIHEMDYFGAVISANSINSSWVRKELNLASVRELAEERVVILPILLSKVELPYFLRDKLYADFSDRSKYAGSLASLIKSMEPGANLKDLLSAAYSLDAAVVRRMVIDSLSMHKDKSWVYVDPSPTTGIYERAARASRVPVDEHILGILNLSGFFWWNKAKSSIVFTEKWIYLVSQSYAKRMTYIDFAHAELASDVTWSQTGFASSVSRSFLIVDGYRIEHTILSGGPNEVMKVCMDVQKRILDHSDHGTRDAQA